LKVYNILAIPSLSCGYEIWTWKQRDIKRLRTEEMKFMKLIAGSLCSVLHDSFSSLSGPNIFFKILFSETLSLCFSLKVRAALTYAKF
jgi:hypothetical protein